MHHWVPGKDGRVCTFCGQPESDESTVCQVVSNVERDSRAAFSVRNPRAVSRPSVSKTNEEE